MAEIGVNLRCVSSRFFFCELLKAAFKVIVHVKPIECKKGQTILANYNFSNI